MKIWKGAVLFCFAVAMAGQAAAQSTGDDWRLVAYNFARVNNYNIDDKEVTVTLDTREQRIAGNAHDLHPFFRFSRQRHFKKKSGRPDDSIQRRAYFMAHIR